MWKLYASYDRGVAIRSTIHRLNRSITLPKEIGPQLTFQAVTYTADHGVNPQCNLNTNVPIAFSEIMKAAFVKRLCFDYEEEWRGAIYQCNPDLSSRDVPGIEVTVDLEQLIEAIYVSPVSEPFFKDVVNSVVQMYGLNRPVEKVEWPVRDTS